MDGGRKVHLKVEESEIINTCGVVLAGGLSRRYGSPKAFSQKDGQFYYTIAYQLLTSICDNVVIVSRTEHLDRFRPEEFVISDEPSVAGLGPLSGIYSAMLAIKAKNYLILPCDMPNMEKQVLTKLVTIKKVLPVTAMKAHNTEHPLVSIWSRDMIHLLKDSLDKRQLRTKDLLTKTGVTWIDACSIVKDVEYVFKNVNYNENRRR